jgi:hypothetical protein
VAAVAGPLLEAQEFAPSGPAWSNFCRHFVQTGLAPIEERRVLSLTPTIGRANGRA